MLRYAITAAAFTATVSLAQTGQPAAGAAAGGQQQTLEATVVETGSTTTCKQGSHTRTVSITSKEPGKSTPCEVHYKKETEQAGHDQVLYTANNDATFCEAKAKEFVQKLTGMGWTCQ